MASHPTATRKLLSLPRAGPQPASTALYFASGKTCRTRIIFADVDGLPRILTPFSRELSS